MGDPEAAVSAGHHAVELMPYDRDAMDAGHFVWNLIRIHALLGQKEDAIRELDRYLSHPGIFGAGYIERHPLFDFLKGDPAFQAVLRSHSSRN